jgi:hypothetical protein
MITAAETYVPSSRTTSSIISRAPLWNLYERSSEPFRGAWILEGSGCGSGAERGAESSTRG